MVYAIDTNILVYAFNLDSPLNPKAHAFLKEEVLTGSISTCLPYQSLYEFYSVITNARRVEKPLPTGQAREIIETYIRAKNIPKIYPRKSNLRNVINLLSNYDIAGQDIFDLVFVATLLDNGVDGIITRNTKHFARFEFLNVMNPLD
ncbi:MAG TPA: PIN domain-containing protein [Thermodesulfobacteriota bacterium]|nr:PIN domain-containing protein [Thermodesulfobacteriota bacterium]